VSILKKRQRIYAVALVTTILIAVTIFVTYEHYANSRQQNDGSLNTSFFVEPVVDVILPSLFSNGANAPLNLTRGATASLPVEIFPEVNLNVTLDTTLSSLSYPNQNVSNVISTSFNPPRLSIAEGSRGNTTLDISVSQTAQTGEYSVTVTATNLKNESQYWGDIFQLNVLQ
jgi:hypothetical protein